MMALWVVALSSLNWPMLIPYAAWWQGMMGITLLGHIGLIVGYRAYQAQPLTWLLYLHILLFGLIAILVKHYNAKLDQPT